MATECKNIQYKPGTGAAATSDKDHHCFVTECILSYTSETRHSKALKLEID